MRERIVFKKDDRIAVVAPHPDDECLGAAAALILAPDRTDIYVLTDGSHGNPEKSIEEEREIRRAQFDAEMEAVKPHAWEWLGYEDTTLPKQNLEFSFLIIRRLQEDGKLPGREGERLRVGFLTGGGSTSRGQASSRKRSRRRTTGRSGGSRLTALTPGLNPGLKTRQEEISFWRNCERHTF